MFNNIKPETKAVIAEVARVCLGISVVTAVGITLRRGVEKLCSA